ncbi:recombination regulator RecX [Corynebacterium rouxii]|uniref:Regulatory protein RecX n=1 Tax=Corynebacterium rouxii TaxID=2719119 RepID=A0A6I8MGG4_9CORY|nr:recombination regulator RecX [Corynebacterium rouxii]MDT9409045.1 recombination regulator RecX [Corynebacterium rouxii]MDT9411226.1 recombination regulator RecX [Corynebacterium rouxii]VZH85526.1 recombination regulator RecX [Corynebacterium rouxii]
MTNNQSDSARSGNASAAQSEKIAQLKAALQNFSSSNSNLFDHALEEEKAKVRKRALLLLDQRARSVYELTNRLISADFDPHIVEYVVEDLIRANLLNDENFSREWVRQRRQRRGKSRQALTRELRDKGIKPEIIADVVGDIQPEDEQNIARELAYKKARSLKEEPCDYPEYQKALRRTVGVLARRGFSQSMALEIAREAIDARIDEIRR